MYRPPCQCERHPALRNSCLKYANHIAIDDEAQQSDHQIAGTASTRIYIAQRNCKQHQQKCHQWQCQSPQQFTEVHLAPISKQRFGRQCRRRLFSHQRLRLPRNKHAVAFKLHDLKIRLIRHAVVPAPLFHYDVFVAMLVGLDGPFLCNNNGRAIVRDGIDENIVHASRLTGYGVDKKNTVCRR